MITTGCEGCCFLKEGHGGKGCALHQVCIAKDDMVFAPGYCRFCRSHKWARQQNEPNIGKMMNLVLEENELKFDLLVFFDENINSVADLERTLGTGWYVPYAKRAIIIDVTGFGKRRNFALEYLHRKHNITTVVDSSVQNEPILQRENTIRRISKQVKSPFFMTIPAGMMVKNMDYLANCVQNIPSRVVHWSFPCIVGGTIVISNKYQYGLFITKPYMALTRPADCESFSRELQKEEDTTDMHLSWFCSECGLI